MWVVRHGGIRKEFWLSDCLWTWKFRVWNSWGPPDNFQRCFKKWESPKAPHIYSYPEDTSNLKMSLSWKHKCLQYYDVGAADMFDPYVWQCQAPLSKNNSTASFSYLLFDLVKPKTGKRKSDDLKHMKRSTRIKTKCQTVSRQIMPIEFQPQGAKWKIPTKFQSKTVKHSSNKSQHDFAKSSEIPE